MKYDIQSAIDLTTELLDWYKEHKPEQHEQQFSILGQQRSQLREIRESLKEKPAIAAYGESQKGKSYLMGNLLQKEGKPFTLTGPDREYDFVAELNPIGNGQEATGVVTRFTSFDLTPDRYSKEHPVIMKVFSVADIVAILSDGMHNDVLDGVQHTDEEINQRVQQIIKEYGGRPKVQSMVCADDILDIQRYLKNFVSHAQNIYRSPYLQKLAMVIESVPESDFKKVFSLLWMDNKDISELFDRLFAVIKKLGSSREIYLDIDAIAHNGLKPRTIMSVDCLKGLYSQQYDYKTDVYIRNADGTFRTIHDFDRSQLSAVCSEVVVKIGEKFLDARIAFAADDLPEETLAKLRRMDFLEFDAATNKFTFPRTLLQVSDLLDFPGARSRETLKTDLLDKIDPADGSSNKIKVLLRGKVAYLFNRYSDSRRVNLLMFCHDIDNVDFTRMYITIEEWIKRYVGKTAEDRAETVKEAGGIPPFFIISTKFNFSMSADEGVNSNNENAVNNRWNARFNILYKDCLQGAYVDWFCNWTRKDETFRNAYVLRDYKYSGCTAKGNHLFDGYNSQDENPSEKVRVLDDDYYSLLRSTFITNPDVNKFIADPALGWDLAATRNNDGAALIIYNLTNVAQRLSKVRESQFDKFIADQVEQIRRIADSLYEEVEGTKNTEDDLRKIRNILLDLDTFCSNDPSYFGRLINALQMTTNETYALVHKAMADPEVVNEVIRPDKGEIMRQRILPFNTPEEGMTKLCRIYGFRNPENAKSELAARGIDIDVVLGKKGGKKRLSDVITAKVMEAWSKKILSPEVTALLDGDVRDGMGASLSVITSRMDQVAHALNIDAIASESLSDIVNVVKNNSVNEVQATDILRNIINQFVCDWGYAYRTSEDMDEIREVDDNESLNIFDTIDEADRKQAEVPSFDDLAEIFDEFDTDRSTLTRSFQNNYFRWIACLKMGFVSNCRNSASRPRLGEKANDAIGEIFSKAKLILGQ